MTDHVAPAPSRLDMAVFSLKAAVLRARRRVLENPLRRPTRHSRAAVLAGAAVIAESRSSLWHPLTGQRDRALTLGKIENLRRAVSAIDGVEVPAGEVFSFWRQVGPPRRSHGFVEGRELREGCIIRSVGGGLCQLSNALYEAALAAGFTIVERHAHSRIVPGSRAALGRDATVFWNYVDLRFSSPRPFRIEAALTTGELIVRFRGGGRGEAVVVAAPSLRQMANDCTTCGRDDCHLNDPERPASCDRLPASWLVDACWPEFGAHMQRHFGPEDRLYLPQRLRRSARHDWPSFGWTRESRATLVALRRALALRRLPGQGRALQAELLKHERTLAERYARGLSHHHGHLVISQPLLPHLWDLGVLGGRSFDVLMERLPLDLLQDRLDAAKRRYPHSATLTEFRAPDEIIESEHCALARAARLISPHTDIQTLSGSRALALDWAMPDVPAVEPRGRTILFPASALARKGLYALREAARGLNLTIAVTGRAREAAGDLWPGLRVVEAGEWTSELAGVVLPAIVEHQPRSLLKALAMGLPVIATPACGIAPRPGLTLVDPYDPDELHAALKGLVGRMRELPQGGDGRPSTLR